MMKQRPQITIVEPMISTPAWRSASPKNLKTRPRSTSPITRPQNFVMSPNEAIQSFGTVSQPITMQSYRIQYRCIAPSGTGQGGGGGGVKPARTGTMQPVATPAPPTED